MVNNTRRKLQIATIVFWILLLYIIAALVWWAFSLVQQNREIHELRKESLSTTSTTYRADIEKIADQEGRGYNKYMGEGAAFLLLILVGAFYIYRSVRRQFKLQQQQQNFVMAITHELKTPIAVSRLNLETLQKHQLDEVKQKRLVQATLQETMRLDTLINNILIASQLEGNAYRISKEELDLSSLLTDVLKSFQDRYPERVVTADIAADIEIEGDTMLLKLLLSNLLENAYKYSGGGKPIGLRLSQANSKIIICITDEGAGIPDEEKKEVFQKFYRIGNEQTRKTQGTGLGLYICRKIVKDHGGDIFIKDNQPSGSKFIVQFQRTMIDQSKPSVLLVEDETNLHETLKMNLELEGYQVTSAFDGVQAMKAVANEYFDLIIMDVMIPEVDGFSVTQNIRLSNTEVPILILSAKDSSADRVTGLKKGADDYLTKPFNLEELLLRVQKLIKKNKRLQDKSTVGDTYVFGGNQLDFKAQQATTAKGEKIDLSKKEAMLLKLLIENKNEVVTREKILQSVWGYNVYPTTRTIDNFILSFRKYFEEDSRSPKYFHSVRGVGYKYAE